MRNKYYTFFKTISSLEYFFGYIRSLIGKSDLGQSEKKFLRILTKQLSK